MSGSFIADQGIKPMVTGQRAAVSTGNPIVTGVAHDVLKAGGNAADAAVAAAITQATVEPHLTSHAGMMTCLYYEAATGKVHYLNATGTLAPDLPPFRPLNGVGGFAPPGQPGPQAAIPGFMPGMGALHERFGTREWAELVSPAIDWAENGHPVSSFEYGVNVFEMPFSTYFPSSRAVIMPNGHLVPVGERMANPALAETLSALAAEGPSLFTTGQWARDFVAAGNDLGWGVRLDHMSAVPPRWDEPMRFAHGADEIVTLSPPERQGVFCAFTLGVMRELGVTGMEPSGADHLYYLGHVMRMAEQLCGFVHDPEIFESPAALATDPDYHRQMARLLKQSRPKSDLSEHMRLTQGPVAQTGAGVPKRMRQPAGSCEISIVDGQGNWVQLMNSLQSGGIPGMAVGGVVMMGSHSIEAMNSHFVGWRVPGSRMRSIVGNTFIMRDGAPRLSLGTPGNVYATVAQMLINILDFGMTPPEASDAPRALPLTEDYRLEVESRLTPDAVAGLTALGIALTPSPEWDWNMGSFQMCWRDAETGTLSAHADFRRTGAVAGIA
ncbi:gamma-glutamyltransferase [Cucumibacter marinus]|uniref:gamma-glutamyltransferase n=1 Tax=Cucumibacter marinus TaxID=1121252 RepID=UPI00041A5323|nr:gamma-glutamyltransferase [Cucumibacter marinus]